MDMQLHQLRLMPQHPLSLSQQLLHRFRVRRVPAVSRKYRNRIECKTPTARVKCFTDKKDRYMYIVYHECSIESGFVLSPRDGAKIGELGGKIICDASYFLVRSPISWPSCSGCCCCCDLLLLVLLLLLLVLCRQRDLTGHEFRW